MSFYPEISRYLDKALSYFENNPLKGQNIP